MITASVILDIPTQSLDTPHTYVVPDHMVDAEVGCAVLVPFGTARRSGSSSRLAKTTPAPGRKRVSRLRTCSTTSPPRLRGAFHAPSARGRRRTPSSSRRGSRASPRQRSGTAACSLSIGTGASRARRISGSGAQYEAASPKVGFAREQAANIKIKPIERVLSKPYFDEEGAACACFLSATLPRSLSSCVRLFTPPGGVARMVRSREGVWRLEEPAVGEVDDRW